MNEISTTGKTIKRLVESSMEETKPWIKLGDDIERYTTSNDYDFLYQDAITLNSDFKARINKASEFVQILGAFLYPHNPDATVNSESWADPWAQQRHRIEEQYADYAARHGMLDKHMRRAVDHSLVYGRGVLWTGFNPDKGVVQTVFDRCENLVLDPDAKAPEEQNFQGRKRIKPRWKLIQLYPDQQAVIERLPAYAKPGSNRKDSDSTTDLVCYYEMWMGVGVTNYMPSSEVAQMDGVDIHAKKKYVVADGHVIHEGEWEIPFFLIDEFPGTYLDPLERPGCMLPLQPMEPGMGHLRAMNYAYTLLIEKWKLMSRTPFAAMTHNGQGIDPENLFKVLRGESIDILLVKTNGTDEPPDIHKYFQRIDWGDPLPGFERLWSIMSAEFEKSTGLAEVLYAGQTPTQLRSAKAAELVEQNSRTRSDSMREVVTKTLERLYRKTLFAARYLHGSEDIATLFGPDAGRLWGEIANPQMVQQETMQRQMMQQQAAQMGVPPEQVEQMMGPPQFVDMSKWIHEADRTIDAGSMRRLDMDAQAQNINVALNQFGPAVGNMPGGGEYVAALAVEFAKINRLSPELQQASRNLVEQIRMAQQMQMAPPPGQVPPESAPQTGPTGGEPQG